MRKQQRQQRRRDRGDQSKRSNQTQFKLIENKSSKLPLHADRLRPAWAGTMAEENGSARQTANANVSKTIVLISEEERER